MFCTPAGFFIVGFSMGASLACTVVASMLQGNLLGQEVITESLACITFGQPLSAIVSLEKLFSEREYLKKCFHYVYVSEDTLPMLLTPSLFGQSAVSYTLHDVRYYCRNKVEYRQYSCMHTYHLIEVQCSVVVIKE